MTGTNDEAAVPSDMGTPVRVSYGMGRFRGCMCPRIQGPNHLTTHKIVPCSIQGVSVATKLNEQRKHQIWILQSTLNRPLYLTEEVVRFKS